MPQNKASSMSITTTLMVDSEGGLKAHLGYDTVHPNAAGYQLMEQILSNYID